MEKQSGQGTITQRLEFSIPNPLPPQLNQIPFQIALPNKQQTTILANQFLREIQANYERFLAGLLSCFREVSEDDLKSLKDHKKDLFCSEESTSSALFKLGDQVKIILKHRQFKKFNKRGWNECMKNDYDQVGIVIGLLIANPSEVVVFFPRSGQSWVIHKAALQIVEDTLQDGTNIGLSFNKLQMGDSVEINNNLSENNILMIQAYHSLPDLGLKSYRKSLRKILAFDRKGAAYVSVSELESTTIHSSLLKKANKPHTPIKQKITSKGKLIKDNIEDLIKSSNWNASHTQIVGQPAKLLDEPSNGICQIEVHNKIYYVAKDYFVTTKKQKEQKRPRRGRQCGDRKKSLKFPFEVGDILKLDMDLMNQNPGSVGLLDIAEELRVVFVGYCKNGMVSVSVNWPSSSRNIPFPYLNTSISLWKKSSGKSAKAYEEWEKKRNRIQAGDDVSLYGAQHWKFVQAKLNDLFAPEYIIEAVTSNVQLVAFNDDTDEAVLRLKNGNLYACPAEFVCPTTDESKHKDTRLSRSLLDIWTVANLIAKSLLMNDRLKKWEIKENVEKQNESWNTTICIDKIPINYEKMLLRGIAFNIKHNHQCETDFEGENLLIIRLNGCSGKVTIKVSSLHNDPETKLALGEAFLKITEEIEETLKDPPANETGSSPDPVQADCGDELTNDTDDKSEKLNKSKNEGIGKKDIQPGERPHCSNTGPVIDQDDTDRIPSRAENDDDEDSSDEDIINVLEEPTFIPSQPENEFESFDNSNRELGGAGENINAGENRDGEVRRPATLTLNHRTNEVVMRGNLGSNPRVREEGGNRLMRQNSQVENSTRGEPIGVYGGVHNNFNNCTINNLNLS